MSFTISRFCPCRDGEIVGDFKGDDAPIIECKICAETHYFKRVNALGSLDGCLLG